MRVHIFTRPTGSTSIVHAIKESRVFIIVLIICLSALKSNAADIYWVGGSGNWSDNFNHWSLSSGGAPGSAAPGPSDIAIIDANSGGGVITVDQHVNILGLHLLPGFSGTFDNGNFNLSIGISGIVLDAGHFIAPGSNNSFILAGNIIVSNGMFNHNQGTLDFIGGTKVIDPRSTVFNNVKIQLTGISTFTVNNVTSADPWIIEGSLNIDFLRYFTSGNSGSVKILGDLTINEVTEQMGGEIQLFGNLIVLDNIFSGFTNIRCLGSDLQNITLTSFCPGISIEKTNSGEVHFVNGTDLVFPAQFEISYFSGRVTGGFKNGVPTDNYISSALYTQHIKNFTPGNLVFGNVTVDMFINANQNFNVHNTSLASPWIIEGDLNVISVWNFAGGSDIRVSGDLNITQVENAFGGDIYLSGDLNVQDNQFSGFLTVHFVGSDLQNVTLNSFAPGLSIEKINNGEVHFVNGTDLVFPAQFEISYFSGRVTGGFKNGVPTDNYINSALYTQQIKSFTPGNLVFGNVTVDMSISANQSFNVHGTGPASPWIIEGDLNIISVWNFSGTSDIRISGDLNITQVDNAFGGDIYLSGDLIVLDNQFSGFLTVHFVESNLQNVKLNSFAPGLSIEKTNNGEVHFVNGTDLVFPAQFEISYFSGRVTGGYKNGVPTDNYISSVVYSEQVKIFTPGILRFGNVTVNISTNINQRFTVNGTSLANPWLIEGNLDFVSAWAYAATSEYIKIDGNFSIGTVSQNLNGTYLVGGNLTSTTSPINGSGSIILNGNSDQAINLTGSDLPNGLFKISKSSGKAILMSDVILNGTTEDMLIESGTLDMNHFNIHVSDLFTVNAGATLIRAYCEIITSNGGPSKIVFQPGSIQVGCGIPVVNTVAATSILQTSVTLNGEVNPNSIQSDVYFEWGISSTLNTFNITSVQSIPGDLSVHTFSFNVSGLTPGTTYYYRAVAQNSAGVIKGSIMSFQTLNPIIAGSIDFDGNDDRIALPTGINSQTFTIEMWVNPSHTQQFYANILDNNHTGSRSWVIQQNGANTNQYYFAAAHANGQSFAYFNLLANTWQHLCIVKSTNGVKVFVNGNLTTSTVLSASIIYDGSEMLTIAQWNLGSRNWKGKMDELRIWNRALCPSEILNNKNCELTENQNGLAAYYKLNSGLVNANNFGITTVIDASGNNLNGALVNFSLNGSSSNWTEGFVSGICSNYITPSITITANGPLSVCSGQTVTLSTSATGIYQWMKDGQPVPDATNQSFIASTTGSYSLIVIDQNGCNFSSNAVTVNINDPIIVSVMAGTISCSGSSTSVNVEASGGVAPYSGIGTFIRPVGTHSFSVTDANGCQVSQTITLNEPPVLIGGSITMSPNPTILNQQVNTVYLGLPSPTISLNASGVAGGTGSKTYSWSASPAGSITGGQGTGSINISPVLPTMYTLTVTDANGCELLPKPTFFVNVVNAQSTTHEGKVYVCHGGNTLEVNANAAMAHIQHGDALGICINQRSEQPVTEEDTDQKVEFSVKAFPNPTHSQFLMTVYGDNKSGTLVRIFDAQGKLLTNTKLKSGIAFYFGENLHPGIYLAEIRQGNKLKTIKLIKQ